MPAMTQKADKEEKFDRLLAEIGKRSPSDQRWMWFWLILFAAYGLVAWPFKKAAALLRR